MIQLVISNSVSPLVKESFFTKVLERIEAVLGEQFLSELRFPGSDGSERASSWQIDLALISDDSMRELNAKYRGVFDSTDVLSFSLLEGSAFPGDRRVLGEIYISVDRATRQANAKGHDFFRELEILFTHGVLHVVGFDHEKNGAAAHEMRTKELEILGGSGLV